MKIEGLRKFRRRRKGQYFEDLDHFTRARAEQLLAGFRNKHDKPLPSWLLAIYVGQARRLAKNPPDSAWGRSMLAARGGHARSKKRNDVSAKETHLSGQIGQL